MKYRMIAIDLDGTLLSPSSEVTPHTKEAIHRALGAGLLICFATGRNFTECKTVLEAIEHYDSAVFVGGAMVMDTRQRVTLHRTLMDGGLARELCEFFESHGEAAVALQDTAMAGVDYLISSDIELHRSTTQWLKATKVTYRRVNDLARSHHEHTIRVGIVAPTDIARAIHAKLEADFGARVMSHLFLGAEVTVVEAFDPSVSKWQGILRVAERHHVKPGEIIAIGDGINDVTMVSSAGLGVAMGNAHADVLKYAKRVIGSNREDGLAVFLEELLDKGIMEPAEQN